MWSLPLCSLYGNPEATFELRVVSYCFQKINKNKKIDEYEGLENAIITAMKKEIGTKTTNPNRKPKDTDDIKEAKKRKKRQEKNSKKR